MKRLIAGFLTMANSLSGFEVQGHRGARGLLPENTLPAFAAGIEAGCDALEMDLQMTQDHQIVIFHDFLVGTKLLKDMTLKQLKEIDVGGPQNPDFPRQKTIEGTKMPTLQEVIDLAKDHSKKIRLNLEIKADPCTPDAVPPLADVAQKIVSIVKESGFAGRVYYSSFDFNALEEIRKLDETATLGLLVEIPTLLHSGVEPEGWARYVLEWATQLKASIVSPDYELITEDDIKTLHDAGLRVIPWTVNNPEDGLKLIQMGADGVITDYPSDFIKFKN